MKKVTVKKVITVILEALFVAILLFNVTTALLSHIDLRTRLDYTPYALLTVEGGSMNPSLRTGDLIVVRRYAFGDLSVGDDVTFLTGDGLVTHRIVDVNEDGYVTRGLTNQVDDLYTMSAETYCGKVVGTLPLLGHVVRFLTSSPLAVVLCIFLILTVSFGGPAIRLLKKYASREDRRSVGSVPCRILACCSALSMLFCLPYFTDAKYAAEINRFDIAVANSLHFSSNYLSEGDGTNYNIQGWDGESYSFYLEIGNYDNELLFNAEGVDVRYGLGIRMCTEEGYSTDYNLEWYPDPQKPIPELPGNDFEYPDNWGTDDGGYGIPTEGRHAYMLPGGEKIGHRFYLCVEPKEEGGRLPAGTVVRFEVYATTEQGKTYDIELKGTFEMHVADDTKFIGENTATDSTSMVTLNVKTNLIPGDSDERVLLFSWDPDFLYINEFESTAFNIINKHPTYFDKANGRLWMRAQAYANIKLEFFKKPIETPEPPPEGEPAPEPILPNYTIKVMMVQEVGSTEPLEESESTPPPTQPTVTGTLADSSAYISGTTLTEGPVTVHVTADSTASTGIASYYYSIDGGDPIAKAANADFTVGPFTESAVVEVWAKSNKGEESQHVTFRIIISGSDEPEQGDSGT